MVPWSALKVTAPVPVTESQAGFCHPSGSPVLLSPLLSDVVSVVVEAIVVSPVSGPVVTPWVVASVVVAVALVAGGWPLSESVSRMSADRWGADAAVAAAAKAAFGPWHLVSLAGSALTTLLAGVLLALAAKTPDRR